MEPCVEVEDRGAVRIIAINRPEVRNAINMAVLVGMQLALTQLWRSYGVEPDAVIGHSMGEATAAVVAGVLTPAEHKLAESESEKRGRYLIKQMRQELIEKGRPLLDAVILDILKKSVVSLHTDISTKTGERIIVFTLGEPIRFADEEPI